MRRRKTAGNKALAICNAVSVSGNITRWKCTIMELWTVVSWRTIVVCTKHTHHTYTIHIHVIWSTTVSYDALRCAMLANTKCIHTIGTYINIFYIHCEAMAVHAHAQATTTMFLRFQTWKYGWIKNFLPGIHAVHGDILIFLCIL